jgi:hypothetical protein
MERAGSLRGGCRANLKGKPLGICDLDSRTQGPAHPSPGLWADSDSLHTQAGSGRFKSSSIGYRVTVGLAGQGFTGKLVSGGPSGPTQAWHRDTP